MRRGAEALDDAGLESNHALPVDSPNRRVGAQCQMQHRSLQAPKNVQRFMEACKENADAVDGAYLIALVYIAALREVKM